MKITNKIFSVASCLVALAICSNAYADGEQIINKSGTFTSAKGQNTFTGNVRVDRIFLANEDAPYSASYVTFEPGARSFWHTHPAGQHLIVTYGQGLTGTEDGKVQEFSVGDEIWCPPNVKHWHGAKPDQAMTHIAITGVVDGKGATWLEEVTDEQYNLK